MKNDNRAKWNFGDMTFSFVIEGRLSGANEIKSANRSHWSVGSKLVKEEKTRCQWEISRQMLIDDHFRVPVSIDFKWTEPNQKRDPDNIIGGQKVILDALVICGVIPNDTQQWIKGIRHTFMGPDKLNPKIVVTVNSL